jgi:putative membrane protein
MSFRFSASALVISLGVAACGPMPWSKAPQPSVARTTPATKTRAPMPPTDAISEPALAGAPATEAPMITPRRQDVAIAIVSDAQVVATMLAYSNADQSYARLAVARAQNAQVRAYAARMLRDGASINQLAAELLTSTDIQPQDDDTSFDLREISAAHRDKLSGLSGWSFDAAYIAGEANYHEQLLARIDNVLLPSSRHPELKKLVQSLRPTVAAHFAQAQQLAQIVGAADDR